MQKWLTLNGRFEHGEVSAHKLSLAIFVAICFFLPWIQVSCGGAHHSQSGFDLARHGERLLWFIPFLMILVFALGLGQDWRRRAASFGRAGVICGAATAFLIFRERITGQQAAGLLAAGMTAWFWLGFVTALLIAAFGLAILFTRPPKT
jgi:hypothetical protein